jgi:hypothetical protein
MNKYFLILLFILFVKAELHAQNQQFTIKIASFSSKTDDELSPVYYKGGIVFCSNQIDNTVISYKDDQKGLFKIFYAEKKDSLEWRKSRILANEITSTFNDGPATFNENGNLIYYSRNNFIDNSLKNINNASNKIGIYSAKLINGKWDSIQPFRFNNPLYLFGTPALTPNGQRIYFSSDMPGGFGGMDLYYCDKKNNEWDKAVNMGPLINTPKNESFPFANKSDKLFFASDGHNGFGGKDLYYTQEVNGKWLAPVHLDSTINSSADEFGLVIDSICNDGYFSTNRLKSDDIFSFSALPMKFSTCDTLKENNYCFTFYDEQYQQNDTADVTYQWDFGNDIKLIGKEVKHCFSGPGKYKVKLSITDNPTGYIIVNQVEYDVVLEKAKQAYIQSFNIGVVDKPIIFNGLKSNLKTYLTKDYYWNFGKGFMHGSPSETKIFRKKGEYIVQLGILGNIDSTGVIPKTCVMKKIRIYNSYQKLKFKDVSNESTINNESDSLSLPLQTLQIRIYFMDDLSEIQKDKIKKSLEAFGKVKLIFNNFGITDASYPFLDKVAESLQANSDIGLEMYAYSVKPELSENNLEMSERWAQELSFYIKNKKIDNNAFYSKGIGFSSPVFEPFNPDSQIINGVVDFVFRINK